MDDLRPKLRHFLIQSAAVGGGPPAGISAPDSVDGGALPLLLEKHANIHGRKTSVRCFRTCMPALRASMCTETFCEGTTGTEKTIAPEQIRLQWREVLIRVGFQMLWDKSSTEDRDVRGGGSELPSR